MPRLRTIYIVIPTLLLVFSFVLTPHMVWADHADGKRIGDVCDGNNECRTHHCEGSDHENGNSYCTCDVSIGADSDDCQIQYGDLPGGWECKNGDRATYDLNFCVSDDNIRPPEFPLTPIRDPSLLDRLFSPAYTNNELRELRITPETRIRIPGLTFSESTITQGEDGTSYLNLPFLGEYLAAVYRYGVAAAAVVAVVMIIRGGLIWTISGGNESQIDHAKDIIIKAVVGLALAVGSYTVLFTINPDLVRFKNLQVKVVEEIGLDKFNEDVYDGTAPEDVSAALLQDQTIVQGQNETKLPARHTNGLTYGYNNIPYYGQYDTRWGRLRYGAEAHCSSFTSGACGPTSFSMVMSHLGIDVNPTHIARIAVNNKARSCPGGTNSRNTRFIRGVEEAYGVKIEIWTNNRQRALRLLREGKPLVTSLKQEGYTINGKLKTYNGHYVVYTGIDKAVVNGVEQEIVRVNDPGNRPDRGITYMTMDQFNKKRRFIYISKDELVGGFSEEGGMSEERDFSE